VGREKEEGKRKGRKVRRLCAHTLSAVPSTKRERRPKELRSSLHLPVAGEEGGGKKEGISRLSSPSRPVQREEKDLSYLRLQGGKGGKKTKRTVVVRDRDVVPDDEPGRRWQKDSISGRYILVLLKSREGGERRKKEKKGEKEPTSRCWPNPSALWPAGEGNQVSLRR